MAILLDTLTFDNCTLVCEYEVGGAVTSRQTSPATGVVPQGSPLRTYQPGEQMYQQREGQDRVTITATDTTPYGAKSVETGYYNTVCDLTLSASTLAEAPTTVVLQVSTSHGPWKSKLDTTANYEEGKDRYENVPVGTRTVYVVDAADCQQSQQLTVDGTSGETPDAGRLGRKVDEFTDARGVRNELYYDANGRIIRNYLTPATAGDIASVSAETRGHATGDVLEQFCEGTTRVRLLASTGNPFITVEATANSSECGDTPPGPVVVRGCTNPLASNYNPSATEDDGSCILPSYGCTDPNALNYDASASLDDGSCTYAPPRRVPFFEVPLANALRFVVPGVDRPALDNTLFADEKALNYYNPGFCQLFRPSDLVALQFRSSYQQAKVELVGEDNQVVRSYSPTNILSGTGQQVSLSVSLQADPNPSQLRVYFSTGELLLPLQPGDRITLTGTPAHDGTYPIVSVLEDAVTAASYLVLSRPYGSPAQRIDATLSATFALAVYDTWQVNLSLVGIPNGCYYFRLTVEDAELGAVVARSEPVKIGEHPDTVGVSYRNFDNAFDIYYSTGATHFVRVVGQFIRRTPATEKTTLRNSNDRLDILAASVRREIELKVFQAPDWLHEKLALAFSHDFVQVEGVEVVAQGEYEVEPADRYRLSNATVQCEQQGLFGEANGDDLGDIDQGSGEFLSIDEDLLLSI